MPLTTSGWPKAGPTSVTSTYAVPPRKATSIAPPIPTSGIARGRPLANVVTAPVLRIHPQHAASRAVRHVERIVGTDRAARATAAGASGRGKRGQLADDWLLGARRGSNARRHHRGRHHHDQRSSEAHPETFWSLGGAGAALPLRSSPRIHARDDVQVHRISSCWLATDRTTAPPSAHPSSCRPSRLATPYNAAAPLTVGRRTGHDDGRDRHRMGPPATARAHPLG